MAIGGVIPTTSKGAPKNDDNGRDVLFMVYQATRWSHKVVFVQRNGRNRVCKLIRMIFSCVLRIESERDLQESVSQVWRESRWWPRHVLPECSEFGTQSHQVVNKRLMSCFYSFIRCPPPQSSPIISVSVSKIHPIPANGTLPFKQNLRTFQFLRA